MAYAYFRYRNGVAKKRSPRAPEDGHWYLGYVDELGLPQRVPSKVATKSEAEKEARELERRADRVAKGLEDEAPKPMAMADAAQLFFEQRASALESWTDVEARWRLHILPALGGMLVTQVKPGDIEGLLTKMKRGYVPEAHKRHKGYVPKLVKYSPQTRRHVRAHLYSFFEWAIGSAKLRRGSNPVEEVPQVVVPGRIPVSIDPREVLAVLTHVPEDFRSLVATAVMTGLRKGELCGLEVRDVHLVERYIQARRSYSKATTKGKKERVVPIPEALVPYLKDAMKRSASRWLFPAADGKQRTRHFDAAAMFKRALKAANVVQGFDHVCRRCKAEGRAGHTERRGDNAWSQCKACGFALWVKPVPKDYQFKDLRSTFGTLSYEATGNIRYVQEVLGHANVATTDRYAAQRIKFLKQEANKMTLAISHDLLTPQNAVPAPPLATAEETALYSDVTDTRSRGLEPLTSGVTGRENAHKDACAELQPVALTDASRGSMLQREDEKSNKRQAITHAGLTRPPGSAGGGEGGAA